MAPWPSFGNSETGNLSFKPGIGQLEAFVFVQAMIANHQGTEAETFALSDVVLAKRYSMH